MVEVIRWTCFLMVIGLAVVIGSIISATAGDPDLYIDYPPNDTTTVYSDTITIYGRVKGTDGAFIKSVIVNNEDAKGNLINWNAEVSLQPGPNPITVVATDNFGNNKTENRTVSYITPPSAPQNLQLTAGDDYVNLGWIAPRDDGGSKITKYNIYRSTVPGGVRLLKTVDNVLIYEDHDVTNDWKYYYQVSAVNSAGEGEKSMVAFASTQTQTQTPIPTGTISVSSLPSGANIELDGQWRGRMKTPGKIEDVEVGRHTIELSLEGYVVWSKIVPVTIDETSYVHATLAPKPTPTPTPPATGAIRIDSSPSGANIGLDDQWWGMQRITPVTITNVESGHHTIELSLEGYVVWSTIVPVTVDETSYVHATLTPISTPTPTPTPTPDNPMPPCEQGYKDCYPPWGDCETNIYEDNDNCGDCGKQCPEGYFCLLGSCVNDTTKNKENHATYCWKQSLNYSIMGKNEDARDYLLKARDNYVDINKSDQVHEIDALIEELDEKMHREHNSKLIVEGVIAAILALLFAYIERKTKKVPFYMVGLSSIVIFLILFYVLRVWVLPLFY